MAERIMPTPYRFDEVGSVPAQPGLYAWYHQFTLSRADVNMLAVDLQQGKANAPLIAEQFLRDHFFGPYQEASYRVEMRGPLKPEYSGEVAHKLRLSELVLNQATKSPQSLNDIGDLLSRSAPFFSSPIYIGVAKTSLRDRLRTHRRLLEEYREREGAPPTEQDVDHSFAYDAVCVRRLIPADLIVYVMPVEFPPEVAQATEYILNRINFPLCGRN
jgi:hypothetical protein